MNNNDFARVKDALNIVDVIGEFLTLHRAGSNYRVICPFHDDKRPSMFVSQSRQKYHCFVCGADGDVIQFVQDYLKLSKSEALEWCAKRAGIELRQHELTAEEIAKQKDHESLLIATTAAESFFISHRREASEYLIKRGFFLDSEILNRYGVGFAPEGNMLKRDLSAKGYSIDYLTRVDVLRKGDHGSYDTFRGRVTFPFYDVSGNVVGFSGRILEPKENVGKYINTGATDLFTKGNNLYGLYQAKQEIGRTDLAYIVEGQFDVLSMVSYGIKNVIAGSGTAFTDEQVKLIHRYTNNAVLLYDGDAAGLKASLKNCELLIKAGITVKCILLPDGKDPDDLAREKGSEFGLWLQNKTIDFVSYFYTVLLANKKLSPEEEQERIDTILSLIALLDTKFLINKYREIFENLTQISPEIIEMKLHSLLVQKPKVDDPMKPGIYGIEGLKELVTSGTLVEITSNYDLFLSGYGDSPIIYVSGVPGHADIQALRQVVCNFHTQPDEIKIESDGTESKYLQAMAALYKEGITDLTIDAEEQTPFLTYYIAAYSSFFENYPLDKTEFINRCCELISYANDSVRIVNFDSWKSKLGLTQATFKDLLKPYLEKRKSRMAINAQRGKEEEDDDDYDPDELPDYVEKEYSDMYHHYNYYPKLNKEGIPVGYMFKNDKGGHTLVGDFYMEPLLHIYNDDDEQNKRIFKINRRFFKNPLYVEWQSKVLLKKATLEEKLINLEAVNFSNGEDRHWTKVKEYMSRHYITCTEIQTYGNQQEEGTSLREDNMFFAFSNAIFHLSDGSPTIDYANELGVVTHNNKNYYLPAYSAIYAGSGKKNDKYEIISTLYYKDIPVGKQVTFEQWSGLMDKVYKINDNGKWATLFAIMCAFRSNIHCIDRLFTAPFFMGPMSSGKTQIAISIRSLFISPKVPIFNLSISSDAAMSTLMSTFRDVPVVLDEYNNKDITDAKFQALKGIVYDGDGRQKRRAVSTKEIENDKVYAPVIICGQETPQRDDNALMSRIIVCEVPKPQNKRTAEEIEIFNKLKEIEDPDKIGLSNILFQVLQLRPMVMEHFKSLKQDCYNELKADLQQSGEIDRLMKTASLFLATCKLIENYSNFTLPFTYEEFFKIAKDKIVTQIELISHTDKLASFFKAMDVMIDSKAIREGRDFAISVPNELTVKLPGGDKKLIPLIPGTHVLFLRVGSIYTQYARSSFMQEDSTQSTIEQNLRSHPAYLGAINARKFTWEDVIEAPRGDLVPPSGPQAAAMGLDKVNIDNTMIRKVVRKQTNSSCIALNYDTFKEFYNIDLSRDLEENENEDQSGADPLKQKLPF